MTERETQIEALWTYEVATEKVLRRACEKGIYYAGRSGRIFCSVI